MEVGDRFPDVELGRGSGGTVRTGALLASGPAVLYFYPRDLTPGCTREAHDFQEHLRQFADRGVGVYGVSTDDAASHARFADQCHLEFPLLVDAGGALARQLGILDEGRGMARRTTYLVAQDGRIRRIWHAVKVDGHAAEVLAAAAQA